MKFKDYKIEIPGCTDILFFAGFTIKGNKKKNDYCDYSHYYSVILYRTDRNP